jgi:5-methylcytosine-specific restriction endonuclease McrA
MLRRSPLRAKTGLARRTPLRTSKEKKTGRRDTGPDRATRELVLERDDYRCVVCGTGPYGLQQHHRKPRRMGGRSDKTINSPSNLISLCPGDHSWVEGRREEAYELGYLVREQDDPAQIPVAVGGRGFLYLNPDGTVTPVPHLDGAS